MDVKLVSKLRCHNPNNNDSALKNRALLIYIATRDGVDLSPIDHALYGSALFGNIDCTNTAEVGKYVHQLTSGRYDGTKHNVYNGMVSIVESDAIRLGFDNKTNWVNYMNKMIVPVAKEFGIKIEDLEWTAAVHMKKGHPHCHYMFWSKQAKVKSPYIHESKQHICRELLSGEMFKEERSVAIVEKTVARDSILKFGESFMEEEQKFLYQNKLPDDFTKKETYEVSEMLVNLLDKLPTKGKLVYGYQTLEIKKEIDKISSYILQMNAFKKDYSEYLKQNEIINKSYSVSDDKLKVKMEDAVADINKRFGNVILRATEEIRDNHEFKVDEYLKQLDSTLDIDDMEYESSISTTELNSTQDVVDMEYESSISTTELSSSQDDFDMVYEESIFTTELSSAQDVVDMEYESSISTTELSSAQDVVDMEYEESISTTELSSAQDVVDMEYEESVSTTELSSAQDVVDMEYESSISTTELSSAQDVVDMEYEESVSTTKLNSSPVNNDVEHDGNISTTEPSSAVEIKNEHFTKGTIYNIDWSKDYKKAQKIIYDPETKDYQEALILLKREAEKNNVLAIYDIGKIYQRNLLEIPTDESNKISEQYYKKALQGFYSIRQSQQNDFIASYVPYRIGKMLEYGQGCEINLIEAIKEYEQCGINKYAYYRLGCIYLREGTNIDETKGVEYYKNKALGYFKQSADLNFGYSAYAYANLAIQLDIEISQKEIQSYYELALNEFEKSYHKEPNDDIAYKLGCMYLDGKGTPVDIGKGISYLEEAEKLNNLFSTYKLIKFYLDEESEYYDLEKGITSLTKLANLDMEDEINKSLRSMAEYQFGKLYVENKTLQDYDVAKTWLESSIEHGYKRAEYYLASLHLNKDTPFYDMEKGIEMLTKIIEMDPSNQDEEHLISQTYYLLGKTFLKKPLPDNIEDKYYNKKKALEFFKQSADMKFSYGAYAYANLAIKLSPDLPLEKVQPYFKFALEEFKKSFKNDKNSDAAYKIGCMYLDGKGTPADNRKGVEYLKEAEKLKNLFATYKLGKIYLDEINEFYDLEKGIKTLTGLTTLDLEDETNKNLRSQAEYSLGKLYAENDWVQNYGTALKWLQLSIEHGNKQAEYYLASLEVNPEKPLYNLEKGIKTLVDIAYNVPLSDETEWLISRTTYLLGKTFLKNPQIENLDTAYGWFLKSASLENPYAYCSLGSIHLNKETSYYSIDKALEYFKKSADLKNDNGQYHYGKTLCKVGHVKEGMKYLTLAMNQNNLYAEAEIGSIYLYGKYGVEKNVEYGKSLLNHSASLGNEYAKSILEFDEEIKKKIIASTTYNLCRRAFDTLGKMITERRENEYMKATRPFRVRTKEAKKAEMKFPKRDEKE